MRKNVVDPVLTPFIPVCALDTDAGKNPTLRLRHGINPESKAFNLLVKKGSIQQ